MGAAYKHQSNAQKEVATAEFIPYGNHVTKNVIKLVSGDYITVLRLQGAAHESADAADLNMWHEMLNNFMKNIASPHTALWSHVVRREYNEFPEGEFENSFCQHLNEKYRQHMSETRMLINELYVTIVYRPNPIKTLGLLDFGVKSEQELIERQLENLEALEDATSKALSSLERYEPKLLGVYDRKGIMFSEVQEFLAFLVDGEWRRQPVMRGEIRDTLCTTRPFFGKGGLLSFKGPSRIQYGAALAIESYTSRTYPGLLNALLGVPFEFVLTQSFTFISKTVALDRMKRQQGRMVNAGDLAVSQITDLDDALDDVQSNRYVMGAHHLALMIRADDQKDLGDFVSMAGTVFSEAGMKYTREDAGLAGCYWSQLPGNFAYRVRVGDITSRNFAAFSCLHNYPTGRIRGAQWGNAVTMLQTTSGSPYYLNFHKVDNDPAAKFDPNHKELAHTIVIGQSGSGKTVLECFLLAQMQKFRMPGKPMTTVLFDKDLGASIAVKAMGGRYYPIKNGVPSGWSPLQMEPTPKNLTFVEGLIKQLVYREDMPLTPTQEKKIVEAILSVMGRVGNLEKGITPLKGMEKDARRLSSLLEFFSHSEENGIHQRLARWCEGGALAWLFDNEEDTLNLDAPVIGFDVTEFLDNPETRTPTILYLLHRIDDLIDGRRIPIFMDEFWKLIGDDAFSKLIEDKLVTMRKQDGFLVMFTQSPKQVLKSPIAHAIIEQSATKIFLPNPSADRKDYVEGFKLTNAEYEIIKNLGEKSRQFLIKQNGNSVVAELNLRGFDDELAVLSGNTATAKLVEQLIDSSGENPDMWLPEFHRMRKGE